MLFGDESIGSFGDGLGDIVATVGDTVGSAVVGTDGDMIRDIDGDVIGDIFGDMVGDESDDFVRAFISWRIFSYNLRHFSTLRTP